MTQEKEVVNAGQKCDVPGCEDDAYCKGKCVMHYSRLLKGTPMDKPKRYSAGRKTKSELSQGAAQKKEKGIPEPILRDEGEVQYELERVQRMIRVLVAAGAVTEAQVKAAYELAGK